MQGSKLHAAGTPGTLHARRRQQQQETDTDKDNTSLGMPYGRGVFPQRRLEERTRWGALGRRVHWHWKGDKYRGERALPPPSGITRTPDT
eukprot:scaffold53547_cov28-Tisochrysis_lutea.AAC.1